MQPDRTLATESKEHPVCLRVRVDQVFRKQRQTNPTSYNFGRLQKDAGRFEKQRH